MLNNLDRVISLETVSISLKIEMVYTTSYSSSIIAFIRIHTLPAARKEPGEPLRSDFVSVVGSLTSTWDYLSLRRRPPVNVPIQRTVHCINIISANDANGACLDQVNISTQNPESQAPEAAALLSFRHLLERRF